MSTPSSVHAGLYVSIPIYFSLLGCSALWAHKRMEKMDHDKVSDKLQAHYLGGRLFGPAITAGTLFTSMFSGYTTTDRFQCQILRYVIVFLQAVPALFYLIAQVVAIKNTFNAMYNLDPEATFPTIIIMLLILCFEWMGGLSSVAITDSIQAFIIILSFLCLPIIVRKHFGGWVGLDPNTYPRPDFYQTPTKEEQWQFWQFALINSSFFTLPQFVQRNYSAKDLASLRFGWYVMTIGPWATMFVSAYVGTVGVNILKEDPDTTSPITSILGKVIELGGFAEAVGVIALTASVAAIMSTADSLIIAISQLVTAEICYPIKPNFTPRQIAWCGRGASVLTVAVSLIAGLLWKDGVSALGAIQFPLSMLAVPPFLIGLYATEKYDFHPWCLAGGALSGIIYVFTIYFAYLNITDDPMPINAGMTGIVLEFAVSCFLEIIRRLYSNRRNDVKCATASSIEMRSDIPIFPNRPKFDLPPVARFGEHTLTPKLLEKMMDGVREPLSSPWYAILLLLTFSLTAPMTAGSQPPLTDDGVFATPVATFRGLPWWAFKIILMSILPYAVMMLGLWHTSSEFPADEASIGKVGIDPDIVELTPKEMGRRRSYDERNLLAIDRRSSIRSRMSELGISVDPSVLDDTETDALIQSRKCLSSVVLGKIEMFLEEEDVDEVGASSSETAGKGSGAKARRSGQMLPWSRKSKAEEGGIDTIMTALEGGSGGIGEINEEAKA
ncbi:hypothetical protein ACHAWF_010458 [Thalassiosira exigua]